MDTTILRKAGLTESQAKGYLALIEHGELSPVELAKITGEGRTNGYMICDKLEKLGLAEKSRVNNTYIPENPVRLKQLLISQQKALRDTNAELATILPSLLSTFRLVTDKPGVLHLEGTESLKTLYDDIIKTEDTLLIFSSTEGGKDTEISQMTERQTERQRKAHIKTKMLVPPDVLEHYVVEDNSLFETRSAPYSALETQIIVYGPNVAMTTFNNGITTMIITSEPVAGTFKNLFEGLWSLQLDTTRE
jgi:sugar-specific transcriptional regulator TrmB